jgi:RNA polymerase subunit RPABC4/transcription elongation factor Spt4
LFNYSNDTLYITTSTAEFISDGRSWKPVIVQPAANSNSIASWITLHTADFTIGPNEEKTISFDLFIPDNARPGGHYWAVFFENDAAWLGAGSKIGINVDYWVLLLVNISWEIIKEWEVDDVIVRNNWWGGWYRNKKDNCPLWDFTKSNFDNKCIDEIGWDESQIDESKEIDLTDILWEDFEGNKEDDLDIKFEIPFENKWNTHIKPTGKITLVDEDGKQIENVGKEVVLNDNGAIIWEKIVDYIPINDIWGNVLPQTQRVFEWEWKWFPYKVYDDAWDEVVKYWSPNEYYTKKNIPENTILNFWERVLERSNKKLVTAEVQVAYTDENGEEIEFNSAEEFYIEYVDTYVWLNKYIILFLSLGWLFVFFFIIAKRKKKKKCIHCKKVIEKDILICPYCGKKQKDKKSDKKVVKKKKETSKKDDKKKKKKS